MDEDLKATLLSISEGLTAFAKRVSDAVDTLVVADKGGGLKRKGGDEVSSELAIDGASKLAAAAVAAAVAVSATGKGDGKEEETKEVVPVENGDMTGPIKTVGRKKKDVVEVVQLKASQASKPAGATAKKKKSMFIALDATGEGESSAPITALSLTESKNTDSTAARDAASGEALVTETTIAANTAKVKAPSDTHPEETTIIKGATEVIKESPVAEKKAPTARKGRSKVNFFEKIAEKIVGKSLHADEDAEQGVKTADAAAVSAPEPSGETKTAKISNEKKPTAEAGVDATRQEADTSMHVDEGTGEKHVDEGTGEKHVDEGTGEKHVDEGIGEKHVDKETGEKHVDEGTGEKHVDERAGEKQDKTTQAMKSGEKLDEAAVATDAQEKAVEDADTEELEGTTVGGKSDASDGERVLLSQAETETRLSQNGDAAAKPKVRRGFFVYRNYRMQLAKRAGEKFVMVEKAKQISIDWKSMGAADREEYQTLAELPEQKRKVALAEKIEKEQPQTDSKSETKAPAHSPQKRSKRPPASAPPDVKPIVINDDVNHARDAEKPSELPKDGTPPKPETKQTNSPPAATTENIEAVSVESPRATRQKEATAADEAGTKVGSAQSEVEKATTGEVASILTKSETKDRDSDHLKSKEKKKRKKRKEAKHEKEEESKREKKRRRKSSSSSPKKEKD